MSTFQGKLLESGLVKYDRLASSERRDVSVFSIGGRGGYKPMDDKETLIAEQIQ